MLACAWLSVFALAAQASAEPTAALPVVHYEAFGSCPARAEFLERMRARMGADGTRLPANTSLRVVLSAQDAATRGTVEIRRGATKTQRSVDGARCEEVVEALALIAALALHEHDPRRADSGRASTREGANAEVAPSKEANADVLSERSVPVLPRDTAPAAVSGTGGAASVTSSEMAPEKGSPARGVARTTAAPKPDPWRFGGRLGATALLFSGLAPALQPGLQLQAALTLGSGGVSWSLQLGGRIARTHGISSPDGGARFGFVGGVVRLCVASALGVSPLVLSGCAVAEPGVYFLDGENTRNSRSHSRAWLAAGGAADVSVAVVRWLSVRFGGELLAPFRRDRVWLAGDALYRVPALGLRLQLGIEVPFG